MSSVQAKSKTTTNTLESTVAVLQDLVLTACAEPVVCGDSRAEDTEANKIHIAASTFSEKFSGDLAKGLAYHVAAIHLVQRHFTSSNKTPDPLAELDAELDAARKFTVIAKPHEHILNKPEIVDAITKSILRYITANPSHIRDDAEFGGLMFLALCRGCLGVPATVYLMNSGHEGVDDEGSGKAPEEDDDKSERIVVVEEEEEEESQQLPLSLSKRRRTIFMKAAEAELERLDFSKEKYWDEVEDMYGHGNLHGSTRDLVSLSHPFITDIVQGQSKGRSADEHKVGMLYDVVRKAIAYLRSTEPDDDDEEEEEEDEDEEKVETNGVEPSDLVPVIFMHILRWKGRLFKHEDAKGDAFVKYLSKLINDPVMSLGKAMHYATRLGHAAEYDADKGCIGRWDWDRGTIAVVYKRLPAFAQATNIVRGIALLHTFRRAANKPKSTFFMTPSMRTTTCRVVDGAEPVAATAATVAANANKTPRAMTVMPAGTTEKSGEGNAGGLGDEGNAGGLGDEGNAGGLGDEGNAGGLGDEGSAEGKAVGSLLPQPSVAEGNNQPAWPSLQGSTEGKAIGSLLPQPSVAEGKNQQAWPPLLG